MSGVGDLVARGRARFETKLMTDTIRVTRVVPGSYDEDTHTRTAASTELVYLGIGRIQTKDTQAQTGDVAGRKSIVLEVELQLPVVPDQVDSDGTSKLQARDLAEVMASEDEDIVGNRYTVEGHNGKSQRTAAKFRVQQEIA